MKYHLIDATNTAWFNAAYTELIKGASKLHITAFIGINGVLDVGVEVPGSAIQWFGPNNAMATATFNIAQQAVGTLTIVQEPTDSFHYLQFTARFQGRVHNIRIPMRCIKQIVRVDDGTGLETQAFPMFEKYEGEMNSNTPDAPMTVPKKARPELRVIVNDKEIPESQRNKDRSHLRVVK